MIKGMGNMMKQVQEMQSKMAELQEELAGKEVDGHAGGDMVTVKVNGKHEVKAVTISKEVVDPNDIEMLQDLVHAAINDAMHKADEMIKSEMSKITGGINIPGLSGMM